MCPSESTDGELIQRTARRDHAAFDTLYRRHSDRVFGLALSKLRDRGRAEDAMQDTFAAIWRSASTYRPERGPGASWLYTVARNVVIDRARANMRAETPAEPDDVADDAPGPESNTETSWLSAHVHQAVEGLPEQERILIELAYWHGLSQSEIAERLGVPLGTVKTRTRAALGRLADRLERDQLL